MESCCELRGSVTLNRMSPGTPWSLLESTTCNGCETLGALPKKAMKCAQEELGVGGIYTMLLAQAARKIRSWPFISINTTAKNRSA